MIVQNTGLENGMEMLLCVSELKEGSARRTNKRQIPKARQVSKKDSERNWMIRSFLWDPMALRTPTSLALFSERAVVRLMKLIQAINKTSEPIRINIRT